MYNIVLNVVEGLQSNREQSMTNLKPTVSKPPIQVSIIIPARYHSSRLPGKPLAQIAGISMLQRVWAIAQTTIQHACNASKNALAIQAFVTTEDQRIVDQCESWGIACILTSDQCRSGTERVAQACTQLTEQPDFIVNLQGDNALCPPWFLTAMIDAYCENTQPGVITPFVRLDWKALDHLREEKKLTPFSGTCVVMNQQKEAIWFSKNIIPAIRKEEALRAISPTSPVARHIGLYGYDTQTLAEILTLEETEYECLEGLEQLSFIEANIPIRLVEVSYQGRQGMTGIDSPEDIARAEMIIQTNGELPVNLPNTR